jgi:hypothetical protein
MRILRQRQNRLGVDEAANWPRPSRDHKPRPQILLEVKDPAEADSYWRFLGRHGYDVSWCPGPTASSSCVLVEDGHCPLIEQADVVVTALKPDDSYARPVLECLHDQDCMKPIIAVGNTNRWNGLFEWFKVMNPVNVRRQLLPAIQGALRSRRLLRALLE